MLTIGDDWKRVAGLSLSLVGKKERLVLRDCMALALTSAYYISSMLFRASPKSRKYAVEDQMNQEP